MKSLVSIFCGLVASAAIAATCTYNGEWDYTPSSTSDDIVITSGTLTWDTSLPATVASWKQTGGTVTIGTTFDGTFPCLEVTGDISLTGGTWTHKGNSKATLSSTANKYRLYVKCGGDMTVGANAIITANALGYETIQTVNGQTPDSQQGGTHGGHAGVGAAKVYQTYGSYAAPEELGNAGKWSSGALTGGGAIRLDVTGKLTIDGSIEANSLKPASHYSGAGGSVYINAGTISGTGTLCADAETSNITGGGGRIAVILHNGGADFSNFNLKTLASAKSRKLKDANVGGCGTIYGETPSDAAGEGWLILTGTGTEPTGTKIANIAYADPFTYDCTSLHFAKISISGKTKLYVNAGYTLDLTDTTIDLEDSNYGIVVNGGSIATRNQSKLNITGTFVCNEEMSFNTGDVVVGEGGVLVGKARLTFPGSLTIKSGGKVTTAAASSNPTHKIDLDVAGKMTVEEGGMVDASYCGYTYNYYPSGRITDSSGGSHGGWGVTSKSLENMATPYGSIINPLTSGSGGGQDSGSNSSFGGGVVRLHVAGDLVVDGSILANGKRAAHYAGAGGSINITAARLSGSESAVIEASGGTAANATAAAGGGRIAVCLTGSGDFSSFLGKTIAYSYGNSNGTKYGGAGTVYLQTAAQGEGGGTLIIDNGAAKITQGSTLVGGGVEGLEFGNIIIRNKAKLALADNATLIVKGNFQNEATFVAGAGSTVQFAGSGESVVSGDSTFVNLGCTTGGKTIKFATNSTQTVTGTLTISSEGDLITLCADEDSGTWNLDTSAGAASLSGVAIGGCQSTAAITVTDGEDLGDNNANVTVTGSVEPATITWTGATEDGSWANENNWDVRVPTKVDSVIIPAGTPTATLAANAKVAALTVAGTLDVADKGITVTGDMTVSGALVASGAAPIEVGGNLTMTGAFTAGSSVVTLNGTAAQTVTCAGGVSFASLVIETSAATFASDLRAASLTFGEGEFAFAKDITVDATKFTVNGDSETKNAVLRPVNEGETWKLKVSVHNVTGAKVSGSDASTGVAIVPVSSQDDGNNVNWLFNDTRIRWTGSVNTDFANPGNWKDGVAPKATDAVVIEGDYNVVITGETTVAGVTFGVGATLTVNTNLMCNGSFVVEPSGTLVANRPISVAGNLTVLDDAIVTHDINAGTNEQYKIDITVGGAGYFSSGAKVDVKGKGYKLKGSYRGPGSGAAVADTTTGASHGGRGYHGAASSPACYGSAFNPVNIGSAGGNTGDGGGAVILHFGAALVLDAEINADGGDGRSSDERDGGFYSSSGGSINIQASSLSGSGSIRACGGKVVGTAGGLCGGGGRIAIVLTDASATLSSFTGSTIVYGGLVGNVSDGSVGTIYTKVGDQNGIITLVQNPLYSAKSYELTDFPTTDDVDSATALETLIEVQANCVLNLTADAEIADLHVFAGGKIKLNGHTLHVHHRKYNLFGHKPEENVYFTDDRVDPGDGGEIIWDMKPMMMLVQ